MQKLYVGKTCPFCQFPLKADSEVVECCVCKVPHHRECWAENGGCTSFGCLEKIYRPVAVAERLEISFDSVCGRQEVPVRDGGVNRLLAVAMLILIMVLAGMVFAYINLLSDRIAVADDPNAVVSPEDNSGPDEALEEPVQSYDPAFVAKLDADYYIDYAKGNTPIGELPIGTRVVDPSWQWEFRTDSNYSGSGEIKPVTWIIVAKNHYDGIESHVTLLSEELIGRYAFDNSTNRSHGYAEYGYNHWGDSGKGNATRGLRPWLNSTGLHAGKGFYRAFSESFMGAVLATRLPNKEWKSGNSYSTQDYVFIPSTTELGENDLSYTYQIGTAYLYFDGTGDAKRVACLGSEALWYWTRSPESSYDHILCPVNNTGGFTSYSAIFNDGAVRPALNLKSKILVSEIMH